jgi:hypothetical protein
MRKEATLPAADTREHRPEKLVAGLNPAIPVFGQADAQKQSLLRLIKGRWNVSAAFGLLKKVMPDLSPERPFGKG